MHLTCTSAASALSAATTIDLLLYASSGVLLHTISTVLPAKDKIAQANHAGLGKSSVCKLED